MNYYDEMIGTAELPLSTDEAQALGISREQAEDMAEEDEAREEWEGFDHDDL